MSSSDDYIRTLRAKVNTRFNTPYIGEPLDSVKSATGWLELYLDDLRSTGFKTDKIEEILLNQENSDG